jgi:hypothetical protein
MIVWDCELCVPANREQAIVCLARAPSVLFVAAPACGAAHLELEPGACPASGQHDAALADWARGLGQVVVGKPSCAPDNVNDGSNDDARGGKKRKVAPGDDC